MNWNRYNLNKYIQLLQKWSFLFYVNYICWVQIGMLGKLAQAFS